MVTPLSFGVVKSEKDELYDLDGDRLSFLLFPLFSNSVMRWYCGPMLTRPIMTMLASEIYIAMLYPA